MVGKLPNVTPLCWILGCFHWGAGCWFPSTFLSAMLRFNPTPSCKKWSAKITGISIGYAEHGFIWWVTDSWFCSQMVFEFCGIARASWFLLTCMMDSWRANWSDCWDKAIQDWAVSHQLELVSQAGKAMQSRCELEIAVESRTLCVVWVGCFCQPLCLLNPGQMMEKFCSRCGWTVA